MFGKIKKFFTDLGELAFKSSIAYSEVTGTPTLGTASTKDTGTTSGTIPVLDSNGKLATSIVPDVAVDVIRYNTTQNLSSTEKAKARSNMGAGTSDFSGSYTDLTKQTYTRNGGKQKHRHSGRGYSAYRSGGTVGRYLCLMLMAVCRCRWQDNLCKCYHKSGATYDRYYEWRNGLCLTTLDY